jgi:hypothetical protein
VNFEINSSQRFQFEIGNERHLINLATKEGNKLMKMLRKASIITNEIVKESKKTNYGIEKYVSFAPSKNETFEFSIDDFIPNTIDITKLLKKLPSKSIMKQ